MTRILPLAFAFVLAAAPASAGTLTCDTRGDIRRCFDHRVYESTEERSRDYVHGWDNQGRAWTTWEHNGRTYTWPTR
jgi:hypothetical protein